MRTLRPLLLLVVAIAMAACSSPLASVKAEPVKDLSKVQDAAHTPLPGIDPR